MPKNMNGARAALIDSLDIREVRAADGTVGRMLRFGDGSGFIIAHGDDGSASVTLLTRGAPGAEYQFPSHVMDEIAHMVAGPTRWEEDADDSPLQYCGACLTGNCADCKGDDACQCDHVARVVTP
jgi:hypothetical protein